MDEKKKNLDKVEVTETDYVPEEEADETLDNYEEVDSDNDEDDVDLDDTDTSEGDDTDQDDNEDAIEEKAVPVKKYVDEKHKRKQAELERDTLKAKMAEYEVKMGETEIDEYKRTVMSEFIDKDMDESYAGLIATKLAELRKEFRATATPKEPPVDKEAIAISKLKTESDYYDNAEVYADKIKEKMVKFNVTAKEAYNMTVDPQVRMTEISQRKLAKGNKNEQTNSQITNSSTSKISNATGAGALSEVDRNALKSLVRSNPNDGWNEKKYRRVMGL